MMRVLDIRKRWGVLTGLTRFLAWIIHEGKKEG
jgi:hypothetical protein